MSTHLTVCGPLFSVLFILLCLASQTAVYVSGSESLDIQMDKFEEDLAPIDGSSNNNSSLSDGWHSSNLEISLKLSPSEDHFQDNKQDKENGSTKESSRIKLMTNIEVVSGHNAEIIRRYFLPMFTTVVFVLGVIVGPIVMHTNLIKNLLYDTKLDRDNSNTSLASGAGVPGINAGSGGPGSSGVSSASPISVNTSFPHISSLLIWKSVSINDDLSDSAIGGSGLEDPIEKSISLTKRMSSIEFGACRVNRTTSVQTIQSNRFRADDQDSFGLQLQEESSDPLHVKW